MADRDRASTDRTSTDRTDREWGFRTRQDRHRGGTPLSLTAAYRMLHSVFYAGRFEREGVVYEGRHQAMVTLDEWERVQAVLERESGPRYRKHAYAYTGMIRCGRCGCLRRRCLALDAVIAQ